MVKKKKKIEKKGFTPKQEAFCREYLIDLNATQAAIRAGFSHKTAGQQGEALLKKLEIQKKIDELKTKRAEKVEVNSEDVLRELVKLANTDIRQVFNDDGSLLPLSEWPDAIARCVSSIEVEELFEYEGSGKDRQRKHIGYTKKVKFWDKTKCLDMLGRHLKLFNGENTNNGPTVLVIGTMEVPDDE